MVDTTKMIPERELQSGDSEVGIDVRELALEARGYLHSMSWCVRINELYYDRGFPKIAVFLADIEPREPADRLVWIVVGDVPPLYLDTVDHLNGAEALAMYLLVFYEVIHEYRHGRVAEELPPLLERGSLRPIKLDKEIADMLVSRLDFILKIILEWWANEIRFDIRGLNVENVLEYET